MLGPTVLYRDRDVTRDLALEVKTRTGHHLKVIASLAMAPERTLNADQLVSKYWRDAPSKDRFRMLLRHLVRIHDKLNEPYRKPADAGKGRHFDGAFIRACADGSGTIFYSLDLGGGRTDIDDVSASVGTDWKSVATALRLFRGVPLTGLDLYDESLVPKWTSLLDRAGCLADSQNQRKEYVGWTRTYNRAFPEDGIGLARYIDATLDSRDPALLYNLKENIDALLASADKSPELDRSLGRLYDRRVVARRSDYFVGTLSPEDKHLLANAVRVTPHSSIWTSPDAGHGPACIARSRLSLEHGDTAGACLWLLEAGTWAADRSDMDSAIEWLLEALHLSGDDVTLIGWSQLELGRVLGEVRRYDEAISALTSGVDAVADGHHLDLHHRILATLAQLHVRNGHPDKAASVLREKVRIAISTRIDEPFTDRPVTVTGGTVAMCATYAAIMALHTKLSGHVREGRQVAHWTVRAARLLRSTEILPQLRADVPADWLDDEIASE